MFALLDIIKMPMEIVQLVGLDVRYAHQLLFVSPVSFKLLIMEMEHVLALLEPSLQYLPTAYVFVNNV